MDRRDLANRIKRAFSNVELGSGIGLWEAQAIDDYEDREVRKSYREKDRKDDWTSFDHEELQRCHSSLSFFDADGMRFHLPAFMLFSLEQKVDDPVFHLVSLDDYNLSRFTSLNEIQRKAVAAYLNWCLNQEEYEFEHQSIKRALDEYWNK